MKIPVQPDIRERVSGIRPYHLFAQLRILPRSHTVHLNILYDHYTEDEDSRTARYKRAGVWEPTLPPVRPAKDPAKTPYSTSKYSSKIITRRIKIPAEPDIGVRVSRSRPDHLIAQLRILPTPHTVHLNTPLRSLHGG